MKFPRIYLISCFLLVSTLLSAQADNLYGLWARKAGSIGQLGTVNIHKMIKDSKNNVYICGGYAGYVNFSENTCEMIGAKGVPYTSSGEYTTVVDGRGVTRDSRGLRYDGFITKYDSEGNFVWDLKLSSAVADYIVNMELTDDENSLVFFSTYANKSYSSIPTGTCRIQYGNQTEAQSEVLDYNLARPTYQNFHLGKVSTNDGSKLFAKYLGYGAEITDPGIPNVDDKQLWLNNITITPDKKNVMVLGIKGNPLRKFISTYKISDGTLVNSVHSKLDTELNAHVTKMPKNKSAGIYTLLRFIPHTYPAGKDIYKKYIVRIDPTTMLFDTISRVSAYLQEENPTEYPTFYSSAGINPQAIDVDHANKNLFIAGYYQKTFTYLSGNITIDSGGDLDGIIVCLDPTNATGVPKWIIKLNSSGYERVYDCQFDPDGNGGAGSLKTVGVISNIPVNFNPLGTTMMYKSDGLSSGFYAEYDLNGKCLKVEIFGDEKSQATQAIDLSNNKITMFGNFSGSPFDPDPSGRLTPLRTGQTSNYIASYSTDANSTPKTLHNASYGAINNIKPSYDLALHSILPCIQLGAKNDEVSPQKMMEYVPSGYSGAGTVNPNYDGLVSFTTTADGKSEAVVTFKNDRSDFAYLAGWIDFNGNGKFEANEVSVVKVAKNVTSATETLKWTVPPKYNLRGMKAFMRIRLTSEELDGTWFAGDAIDGEVEDYEVTFPPRITITKESKATNKTYASADTAHVGDTITYKIEINTEVLPVTLYDSIPSFVDYVPNSATHSGVYNNGEVRWNVTATNTIFQFKVVPNAVPNYPGMLTDKNLYNIAIVTSATDTASSADNCLVDSINIKPAQIKAINDYDIAISGIQKKLNVLANDELTPCNRSTLDEIKITIPPKNGTAQFNTVDSTILYQSKMKFIGLDSLDYSVKCGTATSTARAYILVSNPLSLYYVACPDAKVTIGFYPTTDIVYNWYSARTGGAIIWANTNSKEITKNNSGTDEVWWVEPVYKGKAFPRQEVRVEQSQYCGNTDLKGCYATGTSIYFDDFGGNNPSDPKFSTVGLAPGLSDLNFCPQAGSCGALYGYSFEKWSKTFNEINPGYKRNGGDDHTYDRDTTRGYYMYIDPSPTEKTNAKLYGSVIKDLCQNVKLNFTVWASDMHLQPSTVARPKIEMMIMDAKTKDTIVMSGEFLLIRDVAHPTNPATPLLYHQYGFDFSIPAGTDSILFSVINKEKNNIGNDWALDDIEVKVCLPPIVFTPEIKDTTICIASDLKVSGKFTDDGTFGDDLEYRWEFQKQGTTTWATVAGTLGACATGKVNSELKLINIAKSNEGEYRLLIGNASTIEKENCRAAKSFKLTTKENSVAADIIAKDTAVFYGTNVAITAKTTGITNPIFNWYKTQTIVTPLFTGPTLSKTNVISDSTYYVSVLGDDVCENVISTRKQVNIRVLGKPEIILLDSCSFKPYLSVHKQMIGATYKWEYSADNTTFELLAGAETCYVTKQGYYKVTVTNNGTVVVSSVRKLVVEKDVKILNKNWYKTHLN